MVRQWFLECGYELTNVASDRGGIAIEDRGRPQADGIGLTLLLEQANEAEGRHRGGEVPAWCR
jgi:hypothetical protein